MTTASTASIGLIEAAGTGCELAALFRRTMNAILIKQKNRP